MSRYKLVDAGADNNNCMILSAIAGAPHMFGVAGSAEAVAKARRIRAQIANMMRIALEPGTDADIRQAGHDVCAAVEVLRGWKQRTKADSCPSADHVMRIQTTSDEEMMKAMADFLSRNEMLGFAELTFLRVICDRLGISLVALTNESTRLSHETERWVDVQRQQAEAGGKAPVVIMTDSVHYRVVGMRSEGRKRSVHSVRGRNEEPSRSEQPHDMTIHKRRKVGPCFCMMHVDLRMIAIAIFFAILSVRMRRLQ